MTDLSNDEIVAFMQALERSEAEQWLAQRYGDRPDLAEHLRAVAGLAGSLEPLRPTDPSSVFPERLADYALGMLTDPSERRRVEEFLRRNPEYQIMDQTWLRWLLGWLRGPLLAVVATFLAWALYLVVRQVFPGSSSLASLDLLTHRQQRIFWEGTILGLAAVGLVYLLQRSGVLTKLRLGVVSSVAASLGLILFLTGEAQGEKAVVRSRLDNLFLGKRWVAYDPPGFDPYPETQRMPTEDELKADLDALADKAGFDAVLTFKSVGTLGEVPRLAREVGFQRVLMGIFITTDAAGQPVEPVDQVEAALKASPHVDGYIFGHNAKNLDLGLLSRWMADLRRRTGRPVTTTFPLENYLGERGRNLREIGDWYCPDVHGTWAAGATPRELFLELKQSLRDLSVLPRDKPVLLKMVSCPSRGLLDDPYSEEAQASFFTLCSQSLELPDGVFLSYYSGYDLPWMNHDRHPEEWSPPQEFVGLFKADRTPKKAVAVVRRGFPIQTRP